MRVSSLNSFMEDEEYVKSYANIRVGLRNFKDLQYFGTLYLGSARQELNLVYDTGSSWLWVPTKLCKGCPTENRYDTESSEFYNETDTIIELFYGRGHVIGNLAYDLVSLLSVKVKPVLLRMLLINEAEDFQGTQADGILGLSPEPKSGSESLVIKMAEENVIDSAQFTVYIGSSEETSYVEFGQHKGDLKNVTWISLTDTSYWMVYLNEFSYKNQRIPLQTTKAILDTGSSIIGLPSVDLKSVIDSLIEDRDLFYLDDIGYYGVECDNVNEFYDLKIKIGRHVTRISSNDYVLKLDEYCIFFFFDLGTKINFILLGDTYLKGKQVIHDVENKRVGLFPQRLYYPPNDYYPGISKTMIIIIISIIIVLLG